MYQINMAVAGYAEVSAEVLNIAANTLLRLARVRSASMPSIPFPIWIPILSMEREMNFASCL